MEMYLFLKEDSPQRVWGCVDTGTFRWRFAASLQTGKHSIPTRNCISELSGLAEKRLHSGWQQILPVVTIDDDILRGHESFEQARPIYESVIHELRWTGQTHSRLSARGVALESLRQRHFPITFGRFLNGEPFDAGVLFPQPESPRIIALDIVPQAPWAF